MGQSIGYEDRYKVERHDGQDKGPYFVLAAGDPVAPIALRAYANHCRLGYEQLAKDLRQMADEWERG